MKVLVYVRTAERYKVTYRKIQSLEHFITFVSLFWLRIWHWYVDVKLMSRF